MLLPLPAVIVTASLKMPEQIYISVWSNLDKIGYQTLEQHQKSIRTNTEVFSLLTTNFLVISSNLMFLSLALQNWSGMKCQFKLFRMAMALVCSM